MYRADPKPVNGSLPIKDPKSQNPFVDTLNIMSSTHRSYLRHHDVMALNCGAKQLANRRVGWWLPV